MAQSVYRMTELVMDSGFMSAKKRKKLHRKPGKIPAGSVAVHAGKTAPGIPHALKTSPPVQWAKAVAEFFHLPSYLMPSKSKHPLQRINE